MTDNRTTELLPCPCCDSESIKEFAPDEWGDSANPYWKIKCMECGLTMCGTNRRMNQEAWNTRAAHGTLTAEQVREAIEKRFDFDVWVPPARWQAIADELNELGSGTCEQVLTDCDDGLMPPFMAHCSVCGAEWGFTPKYCHNCGAKVTGTRDERKGGEAMTSPLPCPCCGSAATVEPHLIEAGCTVGDQTWTDWWTASVNCTSCALQFVGGGDTEEEAVEDALKGWNMRAATT